MQVALTAFVVLFFIVGWAVWGLPFYYDFMTQQFGWTRAQVTSGNALSKLAVGPIFGFFAGWIVDRYGARRLILAGILMAGVALAGLGSISTLVMFYIFYVFNALGYVFAGPIPNQVLLSEWFDRSRGKAMGVAYLGIGVGGASLPWISHALIQRFGWQMSLRILGILIVMIALPLAYRLKELPKSNHAPSAQDSLKAKDAFKSPAFYLLILGSVCSIAVVSATQQNLKLVLSLDRHYSQAETVRVLSLVLAFSIGGRLLMGWLADRYAKKNVMLAIYLLVAISAPGLFVGHSHVLVLSYAAVFGIALGGDYMILPLMAAEIFGLKILGRLMGVMVTTGGVAEAMAPWALNRIRDFGGSDVVICALLSGVAIAGAGATMALPNPRMNTFGKTANEY
jgi:MFS family permease